MQTRGGRTREKRPAQLKHCCQTEKEKKDDMKGYSFRKIHKRGVTLVKENRSSRNRGGRVQSGERSLS